MIRTITWAHTHTGSLSIREESQILHWSLKLLQNHDMLNALGSGENFYFHIPQHPSPLPVGGMGWVIFMLMFGTICYVFAKELLPP